MRVKFILPNIDAFRGRFSRDVKYSVFPPIGLATLAGHLKDNDEADLQDENVEKLNLDDEPDLVAIKVQTSGASRAYELARHYRQKGSHVALGGLHVTALPDEAAKHADSIFLGPGDDTFPEFLTDFRNGKAKERYQSTRRDLTDLPPIRRNLIKRNLYVAANALITSRGCPHSCDFCINSFFFRGGKSFYNQPLVKTLSEIEALQGKHVYFLDDNIFGNRSYALDLFQAMRGMGKLSQSAATVSAAFDDELLHTATEAGLRTLVVGFETLSTNNLRSQHKVQNLKTNYEEAIKRFHDAGIFINATFIFGLDDDDATVFDHTVEWAVSRGIDTATFHILTPFPGTPFFERMAAQGRITNFNWDYYDTSHVVFQPAKMSPETLLTGYRRAYKNFYSWSSILKDASLKAGLRDRLRHIAYVAGWAKAGPIWNIAGRLKLSGRFAPLLLRTLEGKSKGFDIGYANSHIFNPASALQHEANNQRL